MLKSLKVILLHYFYQVFFLLLLLFVFLGWSNQETILAVQNAQLGLTVLFSLHLCAQTNV